MPDPGNFEADSDMGRLVQRVRKTLQEAAPSSPNKPPPNYDLVQSKVTLHALGLQLGDKIVVSGVKVRRTSQSPMSSCCCHATSLLCGRTIF